MAGKSKVWFVDDLPRNLEKFAKNHAADFDVTTFLSTDAVLKRIVRGDLPDALLCDIFFYDTVQEAERVERKIDALAEQLRDTANEIGGHRSHPRARHQINGEGVRAFWKQATAVSNVRLYVKGTISTGAKRLGEYF